MENSMKIFKKIIISLIAVIASWQLCWAVLSISIMLVTEFVLKMHFHLELLGLFWIFTGVYVGIWWCIIFVPLVLLSNYKFFKDKIYFSWYMGAVFGLIGCYFANFILINLFGLTSILHKNALMCAAILGATSFYFYTLLIKKLEINRRLL